MVTPIHVPHTIDFHPRIRMLVSVPSRANQNILGAKVMIGVRLRKAEVSGD